MTLIELLVVIAIIALLASLLLPTLMAGKTKAQGVHCLSQLKQFSYAWLMYAFDNHDRIPPNESAMGPGLPAENAWVKGWLQPDFAEDLPDNTNTVVLTGSALGPFLSYSVGVWRCPADRSSSVHGGKRLSRVRSYSMNSFLNSYDLQPNDPWKMIRKLGDMRAPPPSGIFVIIDEREDSIEDGAFAVDMYNESAPVLSVPRKAHNGGGTLSFADGHSEIKKWRDKHTQPPIIPHSFVAVMSASPRNPDILWLRQRTTGRR